MEYWFLADQAQQNLAAIEQTHSMTCNKGIDAKAEFEGFLARFRSEGESGLLGERYQHLFGEIAQRQGLLASHYFYLALTFTLDLIKILDSNSDDSSDFGQIAYYLSRSCYYTGFYKGTFNGSMHVVEHGVLAPRRKGAEKTNSINDPVKKRFQQCFSAFKQTSEWETGKYRLAAKKLSMQAAIDGQPFLNLNNDELLSEATLTNWAKECDQAQKP